MKTAVLGATGYTGALLIRMLVSHSAVEAIIPVSSSRPGELLGIVDPGFAAKTAGKMEMTGERLVSLDQAAAMKPDVVFAALPHLKSAALCEPFFGKSVVIDLSADFRLKDVPLFEKVYGGPPPREDLLRQSVYGLCEWYRDRIPGYDIIANPGCYPTASLLPLFPLVSKNLLGGLIVVNALSGISGAGKKLHENYLYSERTENSGAYLPGSSHRHWAEIQAELQALDGGTRISFTPHLIPMKRGIEVTTAAQLKKDLSHSDVAAIFQEVYAESPFIRMPSERIPQTADVWGSNRCDIAWRIEQDHVLLFSVIDNLIKGASGQAVQNMNIRFGLEETEGLQIASAI